MDLAAPLREWGKLEIFTDFKTLPFDDYTHCSSSSLKISK